MTDIDNNYRNRFLCKNCKKMLVSKESLDNHIINCFEAKIEKLTENHKKEIDDIKLTYEKKLDDLVDYMTKHSNSIENKYISLNSYLVEQLKKMASLT